MLDGVCLLSLWPKTCPFGRGMCHRHDQETSGEKKNRSSSGLMADENDKILVQSTPSDVVG